MDISGIARQPRRHALGPESAVGGHVLAVRVRTGFFGIHFRLGREILFRANVPGLLHFSLGEQGAVVQLPFQLFRPLAVRPIDCQDEVAKADVRDTAREFLLHWAVEDCRTSESSIAIEVRSEFLIERFFFDPAENFRRPTVGRRKPLADVDRPIQCHLHLTQVIQAHGVVCFVPRAR